MAKLVSDFLVQAAESFPDRKAVWQGGNWQSYGEVDSLAKKFATLLRRKGIRKGDRVGLLADNTIDYIAAHFGALLIGAVEVSLNSDFKSDDIAKLLEDCQAKCLIADRKHAKIALEATRKSEYIEFLCLDVPDGRTKDLSTGILILSFESVKADDASSESFDPVVTEEDLASIVYTSGSTGEPKGVMLSHRNLVSNMAAIVDYLGLVNSDIMLVVLPFHYIYGRSLLYTHFFSGGAIAIENRFAFPNVALKTMEEVKATCFAGVPSTFSILLRKTDFSQKHCASLRIVTQAGGAMAPSLQKELAKVIAPAKLFIMYGSTEAAPRITYLDPNYLEAKWGSIGKAVPSVEAIIADDAGNELPQGEQGEVAAKGPNIMLGYWNDEQGTAKVLRNGYYFTGDLGYKDEDGFIFLSGRARDIIKAGGNRISAKEIEEKILELPWIVESAVIGVPDDVLGEAIHAYVVARDGQGDSTQIERHLKSSFPAFKWPKTIELTKSLPKNKSGKIIKAELRALHT